MQVNGNHPAENSQEMEFTSNVQPRPSAAGSRAARSPPVLDEGQNIHDYHFQKIQDTKSVKRDLVAAAEHFCNAYQGAMTAGNKLDADLAAAREQLQRLQGGEDAMAVVNEQLAAAQESLQQEQRRAADLEARIAQAHADLASTQAERDQLQQRAGDGGDQVVPCMRVVTLKMQQLDGEALGHANWNQGIKEAIDYSVQACNDCGPCEWCGQTTHDSNRCWLGGQAWQNAEKRKVNVGGCLVNPWTHFKKLLAWQLEHNKAQERAVTADRISRMRRGLIQPG